MIKDPKVLFFIQLLSASMLIPIALWGYHTGIAQLFWERIAIFVIALGLFPLFITFLIAGSISLLKRIGS